MLKTTYSRRLGGATWSAIVFFAVVACAACSSSESRPAPAARNLVVICIDTLRADHVSSYGYARKTTPLIDDVARDRTSFANAYAQSDWTVPSTASLLTSLYTHEKRAAR